MSETELKEIIDYVEQVAAFKDDYYNPYVKTDAYIITLLQELDRKIVKINDLKEKNEFLMKRDNRCQVLEQVIKEALGIVEYRLKENDNHINARMEMFHYKNLKEVLSKGSGIDE